MARKTSKNVKKPLAAAPVSRGSRGRHGLGRGLGALIGDVKLSDVTDIVKPSRPSPAKAAPAARTVAGKGAGVAKKTPGKAAAGKKAAVAPGAAPGKGKAAPGKKGVPAAPAPAVPAAANAPAPAVPAAASPVSPGTSGPRAEGEKVKVAIELDEPVADDVSSGHDADETVRVSNARPVEISREKAVLSVPACQIARSPWQPRVDFNADNLRELSESIKSHGVIQPLVCRRLPAGRGGGYELIAGERRLRAAVDAGLAEVPIVVIDAIDSDAAEMTIVENIQRQDLNVIEEAEGYRTLSDRFKLTQQEVADRVGKARASVANVLRLLELPDEVKQLLSSGILSTGHAKVLLSLSDETEQILLARRCVTDSLTVRALERLIQRRRAAGDEARNRTLDMPESHIRYLLDKLHERFNSPIRLQPSVTYANGKRAKGSIQIDFVDNEDLSRLLELFGVEVD